MWWVVTSGGKLLFTQVEDVDEHLEGVMVFRSRREARIMAKACRNCGDKNVKVIPMDLEEHDQSRHERYSSPGWDG